MFTQSCIDLVTEMLLAILSICSQEELNESDEESDEAEAHASTEDLAARRQLIKNKILAVGRMQKVFKLLRFVSILFFFFLFCGCAIHRRWFSSFIPLRFVLSLEPHLFFPIYYNDE